MALLTGTGTNSAAVVMLTPTTLNLGSQLITTTSSPAQMITLKNTGNATLNIASIAASGDFAQTNNCGATLTATMSCTINVTFTPTMTGARNGTVTVTDDANGSPHIVALTGTGTDFTVTAPATATVTRGSNVMFNVTVTPVSGFNQAVMIACTGAPAKPTCAPMSASVTPDGVNPINDAITVTSMAFVPSAPMRVPPPSTRQLVLAMMGLAMVAMAFAMRRFRRRMGLAGAMLFVFAVAGCGSGSKSTTTNLTLTGTSGGVSHSATVALTVK
jgi:Abnormal spindle-like microcephaly-assoc'd, ASPM-SPD-2-Hydin